MVSFRWGSKGGRFLYGTSSPLTPVSYRFFVPRIPSEDGKKITGIVCTTGTYVGAGGLAREVEKDFLHQKKKNEHRKSKGALFQTRVVRTVKVVLRTGIYWGRRSCLCGRVRAGAHALTPPRGTVSVAIQNASIQICIPYIGHRA